MQHSAEMFMISLSLSLYLSFSLDTLIVSKTERKDRARESMAILAAESENLVNLYYSLVHIGNFSCTMHISIYLLLKLRMEP